MPCTFAALLVLLVFVKSCQGIVYSYSNECRIYKLGYPLNEARALAAVLTDDQTDSLVARNEHDTLAYPIINQRYFIADNFDRYLAFHKADTAVTLANLIALVNVGADQRGKNNAVPCDTTKGILILVNGRHYLDEHYKPGTLETFKKSYCYEDQKARPAVVDAFIVMQQE